MGAALLDLENPEKVLYRSKPYLLAPATNCNSNFLFCENLYNFNTLFKSTTLLDECVGDTPNVVFPCAALIEDEKIAIYYGYKRAEQQPMFACKSFEFH
jgi:beta-1,4-mannooligosaccharide/beta-1,4-mannosyl-N-acetylglucosamine phosphorylase